MNVYDFDKTIYKRDSSIQLYLFILKKKPIIFIQCIGTQVLAALNYVIKKSDKEKFKEAYFIFLKKVNIELYLDQFCNKELNNISGWYLRKMKADDVWISASPEFLVKKFAEKLGIKNVIASHVDMHTGKFIDRNCRGKNKVLRYKELYGEQQIDEFYSDSLSDTPLAVLAKDAYYVKKGKPEKWPEVKA